MSRLFPVFNASAALSLLLCILLSIMWGLTYRGMNRVGWERNPPPFSGRAGRSIDVDAMANRNSLLITIANWSPDSASISAQIGNSSAADRAHFFWEQKRGHYVLTLYPQYNANYLYYHLRSGVVTTTAGKGQGCAAHRRALLRTDPSASYDALPLGRAPACRPNSRVSAPARVAATFATTIFAQHPTDAPSAELCRQTNIGNLKRQSDRKMI